MKLTPQLLPLCLAASASAFSPAWKLQRSSSPVSSSQLFYDIQRDPPNDNVWSVLANTEKWISTTLQDAQQANGNPLSRKEVSYVCETSQDPAMVLANIFRKLKDARQLGEAHGQEQEDLADESGTFFLHLDRQKREVRSPNFFPSSSLLTERYQRTTLRQTQVLVIPANEDIMEFPVFDSMVSAINQARRNARDYVTDVSLERLDENMYGEGDRDWV